MKIQIPWELFLKRAERNRKNIEACILEACRNEGQNEYVIQLQEKLRLYQQVKYRQKDLQDGMGRHFYLEELDAEIKDLRERILPDLKDKYRMQRNGFELNPPIEYPDSRRIIFIKPGKEAFDVKNNEKYEIYNPDDMLPLVLKNEEEIKLTTQTNRDTTMGELARELAKIKRINSEIFGEVCALLIRMSMYYEKDHEQVENGCYTWSPNTDVRQRISQLHEELLEAEGNLDLWNFLLTCHAISLQEDVKYNKDNCGRWGIKTPKIGRYTHLSSMVLWGDLLGSTTDAGIAIHASKFDSVLVHNAVITLNLKEVSKIFNNHMAQCNPETKILLHLESKTVAELKEYCRSCSVRVSGKKDELIERLIPFYGKNQIDVFGNIRNPFENQ